jgi:hypothetical protein
MSDQPFRAALPMMQGFMFTFAYQRRWAKRSMSNFIGIQRWHCWWDEAVKIQAPILTSIAATCGSIELGAYPNVGTGSANFTEEQAESSFDILMPRQRLFRRTNLAQDSRRMVLNRNPGYFAETEQVKLGRVFQALISPTIRF